jgi:hypothetical protein
MKTQHQLRIEEMMRKAEQGLPQVPTAPSIDVRLLRAKLILEEAIETIRKGLGVQILARGSCGLVDITDADIDFDFYAPFPFDMTESVDERRSTMDDEVWRFLRGEGDAGLSLQEIRRDLVRLIQFQEQPSQWQKDLREMTKDQASVVVGQCLWRLGAAGLAEHRAGLWVALAKPEEPQQPKERQFGLSFS